MTGAVDSRRSTLDSRLIEVAVPLPFHRTLTYAVDEGLRNPVVAGSRVIVPVRGRRVVGFALGPAFSQPSTLNSQLKSVLDSPDSEPIFRPDLIDVCKWIASYYVVPLGLVLRAALPAALGDVRKAQPSEKTRRLVTLVRQLPTLLERDAAFKRAPQQRLAYELLESLGGSGEVARVLERLGASAAVIDGLVKRGYAKFERESVARDPFAARAREAPKALNPTAAQRTAIDSLTSAPPGSVTLLRGVTGSGKTLVYIELLREVINERGKTAIVLVPEIALTPQTVDRFRAVFGDHVAVLHSALGEGERYDQWRALRSGEKRIVVGARSAVFAPLPDLGAIVVDEEHEASYKQGEAPRYHARDVAIIRARSAGAVCVLGSATPSLESWQNALSGKYLRLDLPGRVGGGSLPAVEVVDLREAAKAPSRDPAERVLRAALSARLEELIEERLEKKEQIILLLNRRGYASFVQCSACEWVAECPNCSISLTAHRNPEAMICHYCLYREEPRLACPRCAQPTLRQRGLGTQQVERLLGERFQRARIARMDVDTTHGKWAHAAILDRVGSGEIDILLGTQMIAKGLDFPNVTLVGVIDADVGINLPDFRASERAFQLVSQVAGRAGRGPKGGLVIVQTRLPKHHAIRCAMDHDYERFVGEEIPERVDPPYPPTVRLANVVISGTDEKGTVDFARAAAERLGRHLGAKEKGVELVGPAPCPVERIQQRWRWHFLLRSPDANALGRAARTLVKGLEVPARGGLRVVFDRDPVSLL